jgi:hypothetical protein
MDAFDLLTKQTTRRDLFAAMAMQAMITAGGGEVYNADKAKRVLIDHAIAYADLLIDELDAQAEEPSRQERKENAGA